MLRSGVAYGRYRPFAAAGRQDFAGEAINRAARCEAASKAYLEVEVAKGLERYQRVFVMEAAFDLLANKSDFYQTDRLPVEQKGYNGEYKVLAVWPKAAFGSLKPITRSRARTR